MSDCGPQPCKRNPNCGCGQCQIGLGCDACCRCLPPALCVTIFSDDDMPCRTELEWDPNEQSYLGVLTCQSETHDLRFYFERTGDTCWFLLRSESLGFPTGYEQSWSLGEEIACDDLVGEVDLGAGALMTFEPVVRITPSTCSGCKCLCECLCVTLVRANGPVCYGKVCWDEETERYAGLLQCGDEYEGEIAVSVRFARRAEFCEYEEEHYECDPCDDQCVIVIDAPGVAVEDSWQEVDDCQARNVDYTWTSGEGADEVMVRARCAMCEEVCPCDFDCATWVFEACHNEERIERLADEVQVTLMANSVTPEGDSGFCCECGHGTTTTLTRVDKLLTPSGETHWTGVMDLCGRLICMRLRCCCAGTCSGDPCSPPGQGDFLLEYDSSCLCEGDCEMCSWVGQAALGFIDSCCPFTLSAPAIFDRPTGEPPQDFLCAPWGCESGRSHVNSCS